MHMACHVCMQWVATLSFSQIHFHDKTPSRYCFSVDILGAHPGFQRITTPIATGQVSNQVLEPHMMLHGLTLLSDSEA